MMMSLINKLTQVMSAWIKWLLVLIICSASACTGSETKEDLPSGPPESAKTIYLVGHGWHAGIVIRRDDIPAAVWPEKGDFANTEYLEVGWGDSDYYQTPDPDWGIALKAALVPTSSVLHIVGFSGPVTTYFPVSEVIAITLTRSGFEQLCQYIADSFLKDQAGNSVSLGPGLYGNSRFYRSHESYHLFNNCNAWTARALRNAGYPINPASIMTVDGLMSRARTFGTVIQSQPAAPDFGNEVEYNKQ
jgi:uncharacterized protein (TIGR02117 family)